MLFGRCFQSCRTSKNRPKLETVINANLGWYSKKSPENSPNDLTSKGVMSRLDLAYHNVLHQKERTTASLLRVPQSSRRVSYESKTDSYDRSGLETSSVYSSTYTCTEDSERKDLGYVTYLQESPRSTSTLSAA